MRKVIKSGIRHVLNLLDPKEVENFSEIKVTS